jgi:hypothetical protein
MRRTASGTMAAGAALALICLFPAPAHPANGLSAIGFGAESVAMGGADLAVARDTAAMNLNPAGITQIPENALGIYGGIIYPLSVAHRDLIGNDLDVSNRHVFLGGGGFTHRLGEVPVTIGIGLAIFFYKCCPLSVTSRILKFSSTDMNCMRRPTDRRETGCTGTITLSGYTAVVLKTAGW